MTRGATCCGLQDAVVAGAVSRGLVSFAAPGGGRRPYVERPVPGVRDESVGPLPPWAWEQPVEPLTGTRAGTAANVHARVPRET
ncbi:hypothetical protein [Streptomyces canus]|uniref:hypothetical protein n=1 Tax=Streptomyces canus TaxID=58343 RepID=UPI002B1E195D|nr:hypothetical protein [Streptomyces canus]